MMLICMWALCFFKKKLFDRSNHTHRSINELTLFSWSLDVFISFPIVHINVLCFLQCFFKVISFSHSYLHTLHWYFFGAQVPHLLWIYWCFPLQFAGFLFLSWTILFIVFNWICSFLTISFVSLNSSFNSPTCLKKSAKV